MKLSAILILSPFVSVALAAPKALAQADNKCVVESCMPLSTALLDCSESSGVDLTSTDPQEYNNPKFLSCLCGGDIKSHYDDCLACTNDGSMDQYIGAYDTMCSGGIPDGGSDETDDDTDSDKTDSDKTDSDKTDSDKTDSDTTDEKSTKKNAASSSKSSSLTMAGMVIVGGAIIAAM